MPPNTAAHILVAEDQTDIRDLLVMNLRSAGYEVSAVGDGREALERFNARPSDLLILDLMMPRMDGLEVCKALRAQGSATPILMLTAKTTELDRVLGLELGADDYLTKPFSLAELLARVKALLRRAAPSGPSSPRGTPPQAARGRHLSPPSRPASPRPWAGPRWWNTAVTWCALPSASCAIR